MLSDTFLFHEDKPLYKVIFLKDDIYQSVRIEEVDDINFSEIRKHLERGESIFITSKQNNKLMTYQTSNKVGKKNTIHNSEKARSPRKLA